MDSREFHNGYRLEGYTRITTISYDGTKILLYAHPSFQGKAWYDWVYVHFEDINPAGAAVENYYPARILGFVSIYNITDAAVDLSPEVHCNWCNYCYTLGMSDPRPDIRCAQYLS
jgi:hypothetical protein